MEKKHVLQARSAPVPISTELPFAKPISHAPNYPERQQFNYPPVCRLIKLTLKYKSEELLSEAGLCLADQLRKRFPGMVLGPEFPLVSRIQTYYLKDIWLKFPKDSELHSRKKMLEEILTSFHTETKYKAVQVVLPFGL